MALVVPSRHFYFPTKTTTSLDTFRSKFHRYSLVIINEKTSYRLKSFNFYSNFENPSINSIEKNPNWLHNWHKPHLQSRRKTPILALDYRNDSDKLSVSNDGGGGGGGRTINKIVDKLKKYGYVDDDNNNQKDEVEAERAIENGSVEDILYVEEGVLTNTRGGFSQESPFGMGDKNINDVKFPWERKKKVEGVVDEATGKWTAKKKSRTSLAELTLPESELRRLINLTFRTNSKTKVKGAGVTQAVVDSIHDKWKTSEIARVKVEGPPALNMKRTHEILERKTGGLVIWRSATALSLYRGVSYEAPEEKFNKQLSGRQGVQPRSLSTAAKKTIKDPFQLDFDNSVNAQKIQNMEQNGENEPMAEVNYEDEVDELLDSLGPRYTEWTGCEPLPVDADKLPGTRLTGGTLLSRNKDYLVFYRGKDFLSPDVSEALLERERLAKSLQDEEEQARLRASAFLVPSVDRSEQPGTAGTLGETLDADARWGKTLDESHKQKVIKEAEVTRHANLVRKLEKKLAFAERKVMRAERALAKVEVFLKPAERQSDPESITEEERFMFRKLGLRMRAFLLLGRRGIFDGTVENMHLHWKYRELVKIHVKAKNYEQTKKIALALEAESGGVLVSVDKISKGFAVIVFRGNDYRRPSMLRPRNLLTKRKALARSIEIQRQEALIKYISNLQTKVDKLRVELEQMDIVKDEGDEELYNRLDSVYPNDDDSEEEGDEAYLETFDSETVNENEHNDSLQTSLSDTNFSNDIQCQSEIESFKNELDSYLPADDEQTEDEGDESNFETYISEDESDDSIDNSIDNF
ncbi:hypothetical protein ACFE04_006951 [Oxalis oulophora]